MNMVSVNDEMIGLEHLPPYIQNISQGKIKRGVPSLAEIIAQAQRDAILRALKSTGGVKKDAADVLGISTTTLWRKITELNIKID